MLENREGKRIPNVSFKVIENGTWKTITTDDLFKGKKVVFSHFLVLSPQPAPPLIFLASMSWRIPSKRMASTTSYVCPSTTLS